MNTRLIKLFLLFAVPAIANKSSNLTPHQQTVYDYCTQSAEFNSEDDYSTTFYGIISAMLKHEGILSSYIESEKKPINLLMSTLFHCIDVPMNPYSHKTIGSGYGFGVPCIRAKMWWDNVTWNNFIQLIKYGNYNLANIANTIEFQLTVSSENPAFVTVIIKAKEVAAIMPSGMSNPLKQALTEEHNKAANPLRRMLEQNISTKDMQCRVNNKEDKSYGISGTVNCQISKNLLANCLRGYQYDNTEKSE